MSIKCPDSSLAADAYFICELVYFSIWYTRTRPLMSIKCSDCGIQFGSVLLKAKTDFSLAFDVFLKSLVQKYLKKSLLVKHDAVWLLSNG